MTQKQLAALAEMAQPRISAMERPGATKFNIETLVRLASAFKVGLKVEFVPFSEMLAWENSFSQDQFDPVAIDNDRQFLNPVATLQGQPVMHQLQVQYRLPFSNQILTPASVHASSPTTGACNVPPQPMIDTWEGSMSNSAEVAGHIVRDNAVYFSAAIGTTPSVPPLPQPVHPEIPAWLAERLSQPTVLPNQP